MITHLFSWKVVLTLVIIAWIWQFSSQSNTKSIIKNLPISSLSSTDRNMEPYISPNWLYMSYSSFMAVQGFHGTWGCSFTWRAPRLLWSVLLLHSPFPENPTSTSGLPAADRTEPALGANLKLSVVGVLSNTHILLNNSKHWHRILDLTLLKEKKGSVRVKHPKEVLQQQQGRSCMFICSAFQPWRFPGLFCLSVTCISL